MYKLSFPLNPLWVALFPFAALVGCSSSQDSSMHLTYTPDAASVALTSLYQSDVSSLSEVNGTVTRDYDSKHGNLFSEIFSGPDGRDVQNYFNARVHYVYTQQELGQGEITPAQFPILGWVTSQAPDVISGQSPFLNSFGGYTTTADTSSDIKIGAVNISTMYWLEGQVNNSPVTLYLGDSSISIDSTRVGIIELASGYDPTKPVTYRQAILLHEARHSDCTGGLTSEELAAMRNSGSSEEFFGVMPREYCGHTHIVCPTGTYQGLLACDSEKYGAYEVGAVFGAAQVESQPDDVSKKVVQISSLDYFSRYVNLGLETNSFEEKPDMTSDGNP